jgi:hypothetical protein
MFVALRSGELDQVIESAFGPPIKAEPAPRPPSAPPLPAPDAPPVPEFEAKPVSVEELAERAPPLQTPLPKEWLVTPPSAPLWAAPSDSGLVVPDLEIPDVVPPLIVEPTPTVEALNSPTAPPQSAAPLTMPGAPRTPLLHPGLEPPAPLIQPAPPVRTRQRGTPPPLPPRRAPTPRPPSSPTPIVPGRPPSAPRPMTPLPPSHSIERAVEAMAAKVAGRKPRDSVPDEGPLSQPGELRRRPPAAPPAPTPAPDSPGRYSISRPSAIFGETPPDSSRSLFGDPLNGEKSLDEVNLSYLAEDLENPPK